MTGGVYGIFLGADENYLELNSSDGGTLGMSQNLQIICLKRRIS
jgi:hypothetical protein